MKAVRCFNGESVATNADITALNKNKKEATFANLKNDTASGEVSAITIISENKVSNNNQIELQEVDEYGNPAKNADGSVKAPIIYTAIPDISIEGNLRNSLGNIIIENRSYKGNINIGSGAAGKGVTVNGKTVKLIASTGSVSQDYVDGIVNIGGAPEDLNSAIANRKKAEAESIFKNHNDFKENFKYKDSTLSPYSITDPSAGRIAGDSIYIAAADININGLIQSGYSRYVADIGADALSEEKIQQYQNNGSEVTVQGRTMYKVNNGRRAVYNKSLDAYEYVVQVYYDPLTKGLVVEDIDASGGKIYLTGRISSTGNGRVLAMDGGAEISIQNASSGDLTTGKILNNNIEGKITITDLANNIWTEYTRSAIKSMSIADYTKKLKDPDAEVTTEKITEIAETDRYSADGGKKTTSYGVKGGQRYNWTLGTDRNRVAYYEKVTKTLFWGGVDIGTDTSKLSENETISNRTYEKETGNRNLGTGNFIGVNQEISNSDFAMIAENVITENTRTVTGNWKEGGHWYALWSDPRYHTTWTTKTGSTQSYVFSLKADSPIEVGFIGKKDGSISVTNTNTSAGNINLFGDILNNTKDATLTIQSAGGSIIQKAGTTITTGRADLQAKYDIENIHITSMGERVAAGNDSAGNTIYTTRDGVLLSAVSTNAGNIDVDVVGGIVEGQALPGNVVITKLFSEGKDLNGYPGDVSLKATGDITQNDSALTVKGHKIHLTSVNGGIGTFNDDGTPKQAVVVDSFAEAYGASSDSGSVNAEAKKNIYLAEEDGDMRVGSIVSHEGDVQLEAKGGRLIDALPQTDNGNNIDTEDLIHHWIDAGLIAGTEDYEGAYIRDLKQYAANYKARAEEEYKEFVTGEARDLIKQRFTKEDGSAYTSIESYLAQDETYLAMVKNYEEPEFAWTKDQLLYAIRNAIVNKESGVSSETQTKVANVQGRNVTLVANGVGINTNETTVIKASDLGGGTENSIAKMKLLSNADASDVTMKDKNGNTLQFTEENGKQVVIAFDAQGNVVETDGLIDTFVIGNLSPLGVYATEKVNVTAIGDNAFIAGRSNDMAGFAPVQVGRITAGAGTDTKDVRLYTQEGIYNAAGTESETGQGNIQAKDLIAYGGTKDIGAKDNPVTVNLSGDLLSANADRNVYIKNVRNGDKLRLGSAYAGDTLWLDSDKGFVMTENPDYKLAYLNAGKILELKTDPTTGVIGTETNPIRILNNVGTPEQYAGTWANNGMLINLTAKDAYVEGVNGTRGDITTMRLGLIEMTGTFTAISESYLEAGAVRLAEGDEPGINGKINADGDVKLEAVQDVVVNGLVASAEGDITVKAGKDVRVNETTDDETLEASGGDPDSSFGGNITIEAANLAQIKGAVAAKNVISISGEKGVELYNSVTAGDVEKHQGEDDEVFYTGGGGIVLKSVDGPITQYEDGVLTARSVSAVSGNAITLTNAGNTFREFMAEGIEKETTDEQGQTTKEKAIDGSVDVRAHAGNNLDAGINGTTVYGDVALTNLDDGGLTVTTDIVAKEGKNGEAGNITFHQIDKIIVNGVLQADGTVTENSDAAGVVNQGNVTAGKDITIYGKAGYTTAANIDMKAGNNISVTSDTGAIEMRGKFGADNDIVLTNQTGTIETSGSLIAGNNVNAVSATGNITLNGDVKTELGDIQIVSESGTIEMESGNVIASRDIILQTGGEGNVDLNGLGEVTDTNVTAGRDIRLTTEKGSILAGGTITAEQGDIVAVQKDGTDIGGDGSIHGIGFLGNVIAQNGDVEAYVKNGVIYYSGTTKAGRDVTANVSQQGIIMYGRTTGAGAVEAGRNVTAATLSGDIQYNGTVRAGAAISALTDKGNITGKGNVDAGDSVILYSNEGNVDMEAKVTAQNDVSAMANQGNIAMGGNVTAETGETLLVAINYDPDKNAGNVTVYGSITSGTNTDLVAENGSITVNGTIQSGNMVSAIVRGTENGKGDITLAGDVTANHGDIVANIKEPVGGNITIKGKTNAGNDLMVTNSTGDILLEDHVVAGNDVKLKNQGGYIFLQGTVVAGNDILADTTWGLIEMRKDVTAKRDIIAKSEEGSIGLLGNIDAGRDVTAETGNRGLILFSTESSDSKVHAGRNVNLKVEDSIVYVRGKVTTDTGDVSATAKTGGICFNGDIQSGHDITATVTEEGNIQYKETVLAENDITATTLKGNIDYDKKVEAGGDVTARITDVGNISYNDSIVAGGSVLADVNNGNINIGDKGPNENTITAKQSIDLETESGKIEIHGKTSTETGDITLKAANDEYVAGSRP